MEVEYTICQIQSGQISLAAKTHRQQGGDPRLTIEVYHHKVLWRLRNLFDGTPETITGAPRRDHIDFYFLLERFRIHRTAFPAATVPSDLSLRLAPTNSSGTERRGGKLVRMTSPVYRFMASRVEVFVGHAPSFHATGDNPILHLDIETTPPDIYGQEMLEVHFGIQSNFEISSLPSGSQSEVILTMTPQSYATIRNELLHL